VASSGSVWEECGTKIRNRCLRRFLWGRTEVDLDFSYLVSFDSEEFRVPGSAPRLGFAVVENVGFVVLFKHLPNLIAWGLLAIGPAAAGDTLVGAANEIIG
jgi:hypothetical protein